MKNKESITILPPNCIADAAFCFNYPDIDYKKVHAEMSQKPQSFFDDLQAKLAQINGNRPPKPYIPFKYTPNLK